MDKLKIKHKFPNKKPDLKQIDHGWMSYGNKRLVSKYLTANVKVVLELGVWLGVSVKYELDISSDTIVIAVDLWDDGGETIQRSVKGKKNIDKNIVNASKDLYNYFLLNVWDYKDRIIPIRMDGRKVLKYLKDMGIKPDLIYLDMDHEYEPVLSDLKEICKYFPDVPIIGDDILYHKGVGRAVKEFLATACSQYFLEVDQNAYALIPKSDKFKRDPAHGLTFNQIESNNLSENELAIITYFPNTELGRSKATKWYNEFHKISHNIKVDHKIYILFEKNNNFNTGQMFNIGFKIVNNENANFIFHSSDLIPNKELIKYYSCEPFNPIHLEAKEIDYHYNFNQMGTFMISGRDFVRLNGFSNEESCDPNLWYMTFMRMAINNFTVDQPKYGHMIKLFDKLNLQKLKIKDKTMYGRHWDRWNKNGLNSIKYGIYEYKEVKDRDLFYYINSQNEILPVSQLSLSHNLTPKIYDPKKKLSVVYSCLDYVKLYFKDRQKYVNLMEKYYGINRYNFLDLKEQLKINLKNFKKISLGYKFFNKIKSNEKLLILQYKYNNFDLDNYIRYYKSLKCKVIDIYLIIFDNSKFKFIKKYDNINIYEGDYDNFNNSQKYDYLSFDVLKNIKTDNLNEYSNHEILKNINGYNNNILKLIGNNLNLNGSIKLISWFPFNLELLEFQSKLCTLFNSNNSILLLDLKCWFSLILKDYNPNNVKLDNKEYIDIDIFKNRAEEIINLFNNFKIFN